MKRVTIFFAAILLASFQPLMAQGHHPGHGQFNSWPGSLETIEVTGTILVDSSVVHPLYYLDTDNDGVADYHLAFGPYWYEPASGATRPAAGTTATISGTVSAMMAPPALIVFKINGETWREAVEIGRRGWNGHDTWYMQGDTLTASGVVIVDTTYFYAHYYLDTDGDAVPDYQLGFGPHWYTPASGATLPAASETVTVFGLVHDENMMGYPQITVLTLNGVEWRPETGPAPWAGTWMHRDHGDSVRAYCVNDSSNWVQFAPGHMGHGRGMGMWPDSMFVQFWRIHPDSLPGPHKQGHFAGFFLDMQDPQGRSMMGSRMGWGHGHMRFEQEHRFHFQYQDEDLDEHGLSEMNMHVAAWNEDMQQWQELPAATIDPANNTVTLKSSDAYSYYALYAETATTGVAQADAGTIPAAFALEQNYPNPFNPETTIRFHLAEAGLARLEVYNLLGQKVATLLNGRQQAGSYSVQWNGKADDGRPVNSGIYLLRLQANGQVQIRQMTLLK